jgi:hypothetical protein
LAAGLTYLPDSIRGKDSPSAELNGSFSITIYTSRWMIEGFPQMYLLDHKGVIRPHEFPDNAASNRVIEELVQACEPGGRTPN